MSSQIYVPYRGYKIEVRVTPATTCHIGGVVHRYRVSWHVTSLEDPDQDVASFPEQFDFLSETQAFRYGESRAQAYVDSIECVPSAKRRSA